MPAKAVSFWNSAAMPRPSGFGLFFDAVGALIIVNFWPDFIIIAGEAQKLRADPAGAEDD